MAVKAVRCPYCQSEEVVKYGRASNSKERFGVSSVSGVDGRSFVPMRIRGAYLR
jgi:hypothetical protein